MTDTATRHGLSFFGFISTSALNMANVADIFTALAGLATLTYTVWSWRQEVKKRKASIEIITTETKDEEE